MPSRNLFQYIVISLKGVAMGAADVVPGVSGGTIALISGIYEELIGTIHKIDLKFFNKWRKEGFKKAWNHYNLSFLFALFFGIILCILSLAKVITWLLTDYPLMVWGFFFGLIVASIIYVGRQVTKWKITSILGLLIGAGVAFGITLAKPMGDMDSTWFLFLAGFIAIIAMILPGISGAFILLLLGAYQSIMRTVSDLVDGITQMNWDIFSQALLKVLVFAIGAIAGLKIFSRALNWMFNHHKNVTLAVLTGFMIGALNKIWPWKEVLEYRTNHSGEQVPFLERSILPSSYDGDPQLMYSILFMIIGFATIFIIERLAVVKKVN